MVEIESVMEILSFLCPKNPSIPTLWTTCDIERFLFMETGDVEMYLSELNSLVSYLFPRCQPLVLWVLQHDLPP